MAARKKSPAEELRELIAAPDAKPPTPSHIRAARESLGLSQTAAGALCWAKLRTWQSWEGGEREMQPAVWGWWLVRAAQIDHSENTRSKQ